MHYKVMNYKKAFIDKNNYESNKLLFSKLAHKISSKKDLIIVIKSKDESFTLSTNKYTDESIEIIINGFLHEHVLKDMVFSITLIEKTNLIFSGNNIHKISAFLHTHNTFYFMASEAVKNLWNDEIKGEQNKPLPVHWRFVEFEFSHLFK